MAERLDRFTLANILHESSEMNQNEEVSNMSKNLSKIPSRWWINPQRFPDNAWTCLKKAIDFVIKAYGTHRTAEKERPMRLLKKLPSNYGIKGYEASVLAAHQAAHHLAEYGGSNWRQFLQKSYEKGGIRDCWLKGVYIANRRIYLEKSFSEQ